MRAKLPTLLAAGTATAFLGLPAAAAHAANTFNCPDFRYQEEAQAVYNQDPSDPNRLDANHDGIPCENLPHRPGVKPTPGQVVTPAGGHSAAGGSDHGTMPNGGMNTGGGGTAGSSPTDLPLALTGGLLLVAGTGGFAVRRVARRGA